VVLCGAACGASGEPELPNSVILFIGDGMGLAQARAATLYAKDVLGKETALGAARTVGLTTTHAADSLVTDSAAAATALYTGHKANNGAINILPDGKKAETLAHAARRAGKSVGIISTTRLTHATPGAVYAHANNRDQENEIAEQLAEFAPEVALGGGLRRFIPQSRKGSKRTDEKDLVALMKSQGYSFVENAADLGKIDPASTPKLLGLFASSHMDYELDRVNVPDLASQPSIAAMTEVALSILSRNRKGFFLMVEGGRIDHACHGHDIKAAIMDTLAMDDALRSAVEFRKSRPDTLIVVTADHETGGLGLGKGTDYRLTLDRLKPIRFSLDLVSRMIAQDPAEWERIVASAGFALDTHEKALLLKNPPGMKTSLAPEVAAIPKLAHYVGLYDHIALSEIEGARAGIAWTSYAHTGSPVATYAVGPGEKEFGGTYDNTDIPKKLCTLLGLTLEEPR
jgi:alkaline phosphatase